MKLHSLLLTIISLACLFIQKHECFSVELSAIIEAGGRECFHQYLKEGLSMEVDFQVISGGDGLDITFWTSSPKNVVVTHMQRQQSGRPTFQTAETGEYRFCFDNSFSRFSAKQVHFFIGSIEEFSDPIFTPRPVFEAQPLLSVDQLGELDDKLDNFRDTFSKVVHNLKEAQRFQEMFKQYESIDRSLMELSFDRVNIFSTLNVVVMLVVAGVQVFMIRSLFEDRSKVGRILRGDSNTRKSFT